MGTTRLSDGRTMAHEVHGDGPPLVVLHGITESMRAWDPVLDQLTAAHTVVLVDLPGHGGSDPTSDWSLEALADDVHGVVSDLELASPSVLGHSLGGFVATVLAARHETGPVCNVDQPLALSAFKEQLGQVEDLLRSEAFPAVIGQMFEDFTSALTEPEQARLDALRSPSQEAVLGIWDPVFTKDVAELDAMVREMLAGLDAPYLAIHGAEPGEEYRAWLAEVVPGAQLEVRGGGGHYPHIADPEGFAARALRHLQAP